MLEPRPFKELSLEEVCQKAAHQQDWGEAGRGKAELMVRQWEREDRLISKQISIARWTAVGTVSVAVVAFISMILALTRGS